MALALGTKSYYGIVQVACMHSCLFGHTVNSLRFWGDVLALLRSLEALLWTLGLVINPFNEMRQAPQVLLLNCFFSYFLGSPNCTHCSAKFSVYDGISPPNRNG